MAPEDTARRDRPLRADPLVGTTDVLDPGDAPTDPPAVDAAREAARRPSAELPDLGRKAAVGAWLSKRRSKGASTPVDLTSAEAGEETATPSAASPPSPSPGGKPAADGLAARLTGRAAGMPVRQLVGGAALCLVGVGLMLGWVVHISWTPLLDVGLLVVGAVLVVQARTSTPARPLIALGVVLAIISVATWRADVTLDGGLGKRREAPAVSLTGPYEYRLGTGQLTIDLRSTTFTTAPLKVDAEVGVGRIVVRVPEDAIVTTRAVAGGGQVVLFGKRHVGPGLDEPNTAAALSTKRIELELRVGAGSVEVDRG